MLCCYLSLSELGHAVPFQLQYNERCMRCDYARARHGNHKFGWRCIRNGSVSVTFYIIPNDVT